MPTRQSSLYRKLFVVLMLSSLIFAVGAVPSEAAKADDQIPRPEHPKPQFQRDSWLNLNGQWDFAIDMDKSGVKKGWAKDPSGLDKKITVPFCPESRLSGIGHTDFMPAVWYHRTFSIQKGWSGKRIFLHFGGVDYDCRAWVNGTLVGRHYGGSVSFCFEITDAIRDGENDLVVCALDDIKSDLQPSGKQSRKRKSWGCVYTRTTGIWQTVWLEARPESFIESVRIVPDLDGKQFVLTPVIKNYRRGMKFKARWFSDKGKRISTNSSSANNIALTLKAKKARSWSPADPYLYKLRFELLDGKKVIDVVNSYAGLRKFHIEGNKFYLNDKPIFLRFVLDQGFYPEGVWTAPADADFKKEILVSMSLGFNGARLHEKVFEERFHYWADRLGYLTWGEFADWGGTRHYANPQGNLNIEREWRDVVLRDLNHPSIITWTFLNETAPGASRNYGPYVRLVRSLAAATRALDPTRPIHDASGYIHVDTDIFSVHDYEPNPEKFRKRYESVAPDAGSKAYRSAHDLSNSIKSTHGQEQPYGPAHYEGQPYVLAEYGRFMYNKSKETREQVEDKIESLTEILLNHPHISGFCYTQITDVEQEINGVQTYDRKLKFSAKRLKEIFGAPAKIESSED